MDNQEIEKLFVKLIDEFLKEDKRNSLLFTDKGKHGIFWDNNIWFIEVEAVDAINILIFKKDPKCYKEGNDDYIVSTAAKVLDKPAWWVCSFQDGWYGQSNKSMSISGYLLGDKLRRKYLSGKTSKRNRSTNAKTS